MRRLLAAAAAAALVVAGVILPITPASADPVGDCSTSTGVLVVVDLRPFGGSVARGCDATPTTGRAALTEAGFAIQDVSRQPGFVCRINSEPASDPCVNTPPASAYWSYWHANAGQQSWSYSTQGASSYQPADGSVDAWVFGATDVGGTTGRPCFSPADARAGRATACPVTAQPAPTRTKKKVSRAPTRAATSAARTAGASATSASGTASRGATASSRAPSSAAASSSVTPASTAPSSSAAPSIVDASQAAADRKSASSGSALPLVLGLGLALVLAAGAWFATLRRRRADPGP